MMVDTKKEIKSMANKNEIKKSNEIFNEEKMVLEDKTTGYKRRVTEYDLYSKEEKRKIKEEHTKETAKLEGFRVDKDLSQLEFNSGECMVDSTGYIPIGEQINRMIRDGERLKLARKENYDYGPETKDEDIKEDVTRNPNFDLADASELNNMAFDNLEKQAERAKQAKDNKKVKETKKDGVVEDVVKDTDKKKSDTSQD